jgi:hypothetical protein
MGPKRHFGLGFDRVAPAEMKILAKSPALAVMLLHSAVLAQQPVPGAQQPQYPPQPYPPTQQPPQYPPPQQPQYPPAQQPQYPPPQYPPGQQPQPYPPTPPYPPGQPEPQTPPAPPEPEPQPAPRSPRSGYRPPPSYYYYPPPAAQRGIYRPFTMSAGLGAGVLSIPGRPRENQLGYNYLARIGFGLTPDFIVYLGVDGTGVSDLGYDINQTNFLIGVQYFVIRRLYLRGGLGIAALSEDADGDSASSAGQAFLGGLGVELVQGDTLAFAIEATFSLGRFRSGTYFANAVSFSLSFF